MFWAMGGGKRGGKKVKKFFREVKVTSLCSQRRTQFLIEKIA